MIFLGAPYPILKNSKGFLYTQNGIDQIKSDLLALLLTTPGERVMLPFFGTPLKDLMFEPNDDIVVQNATDMIAKAITAWEPRITVSQISIQNGGGAVSNALDPTDTGSESEHILSISIQFFDPENIKDVQELTLELPLGGTS